MMNSEMTLN